MFYNEIQNIIQKKHTLQGGNQKFFNRRRVSWNKGTQIIISFTTQFSTRCFKAAFSMRNLSNGCTVWKSFLKSGHFVNQFSKTGRKGLFPLTKHASALKDVICDGYRTECLLFLHNSTRKPLLNFPSSAKHKFEHDKSIEGYFHIKIRFK